MQDMLNRMFLSRCEYTRLRKQMNGSTSVEMVCSRSLERLEMTFLEVLMVSVFFLWPVVNVWSSQAARGSSTQSEM